MSRRNRKGKGNSQGTMSDQPTAPVAQPELTAPAEVKKENPAVIQLADTECDLLMKQDREITQMKLELANLTLRKAQLVQLIGARSEAMSETMRTTARAHGLDPDNLGGRWNIDLAKKELSKTN